MLHAASVLSDYCSAALARARHLMVGVRGWAAGWCAGCTAHYTPLNVLAGVVIFLSMRRVICLVTLNRTSVKSGCCAGP